MKHNSKYIQYVKLQRNIFFVIIYFLALYGIVSFFRSPIISPCADDGCFVEVVYASEETPELEQIIGYITKKFSPEGKHVVVQAINCFYSESGLRSEAVGYNKNGSNDVGVAQINSIHGMSIEDRKDYKKNIDKAYEIYKRNGWRAWYGKGCSK